VPIALTDDHRELGDVARSFLASQKARQSARDLLDTDEQASPPFWQELAGLGWLGLHIDEVYGGSGFGLAELVVVIGTGGHAIPKEKALDHVAGYTCGNDVSARDWQKNKPGGQWLLGKSFDSFGPTGPALVTADEIDDPGKLKIQCRLNGQTMQDSSTEHLIFPVDELIAYVSSVATLKPGDLLFTGTPPGVGMARSPAVYLQPGDEVEVEIENIGLLTNKCVGAA